MDIYTDGSCTPNPGNGSWAYVVVKDNRTVRSCFGREKATTNNRMEILAILKALEFILESKQAVWRIHSDSLYALNLCRGTTRKIKKNQDLVAEILLKVFAIRAMAIQVEFIWVRSHNGNRWNEYADFLANNAHRTSPETLNVL